jgi:hypothetical protein
MTLGLFLSVAPTNQQAITADANGTRKMNSDFAAVIIYFYGMLVGFLFCFYGVKK